MGERHSHGSMNCVCKVNLLLSEEQEISKCLLLPPSDFCKALLCMIMSLNSDKSQQVTEDSLISQMMRLRLSNDMPRVSYFVELKNLYFKLLPGFPFQFMSLKLRYFCGGHHDYIYLFVE